MRSHKTILANCLSYLVVVGLSLLTAGLAGAQTPIASAEKAQVEARLTETAPGSTSTKSPTVSADADATKVAADSVRSEATLMNAKDDSPKSLPAVSAKQPLAPAALAQCSRTVKADVVALAQPFMMNRLGAALPGGLIFALKSDTQLGPGNQVQLKPGKRARPLVLRANVGDCLTINFTNAIPVSSFGTGGTPPPPPFNTSEVSLHVQGMEWVAGTQDDGSFVGKNTSSLAAVASPPSNAQQLPQSQQYTLFARQEGTFLLYTMGDTSSTGDQLRAGLFGALNVQPAGAEWYRSQVTQQDLKLATKKLTPDGHPVVDYNAVYPAGSTWPDGAPIPPNTPILKMLDAGNNIVHTDLTAMITGPKAGRFPGTTGVNKPEPACNAENNPGLNPPPGGKVDPLFCKNPASPDRKQPYREITIIYHGNLGPTSTQAFPILANTGPANTPLEIDIANMTQAGQDAFAINYGTGGIGAEIYANRIGVGPMGPCVDCKFEEFFLSAWSVGDPAMLVDRPANVNIRPPLPPTPVQPPVPPPPPLCATADFETPSVLPGAPICANQRNPVAGFPYTLAPLVKATRAYYPDDPSNVYHSYINDHVKFRILHGGTDVTHVHHQHAHQWLQSPNSDEGSYLDSQMISPGASYTLEMVYNGSGNRNKVVGDSIFHCHFYPHFAAGMWAMWRTHDVFEGGSELANGIPVKGTRAYPDGEIKAGTPIPALVPLPTLPMAPLPSSVFIDQGQVVYGTPGAPDTTGQNVTVNPGFPFFIPGIAGARAPHPPFDFAPDGSGGFLDGGLPRHIVTGGSVHYESHDRFDWSKDLQTIKANQLSETGTPVEKVAIDFFKTRCHQTPLPDGTLSNCALPTPFGFIVNGLPLGPQPGAPFADPAVDDNGKPINFDPVTNTQKKRVYKAAAIQLNVAFNKKGWHFPQQRMLTLWDDVSASFTYRPGDPSSGRKPEPLFFRGNSGDIIEYWHTNLVPNYYQVDDFQVRTPTDILGQHIHLVKFDVTSSDGAGNGFNYEDGTFAPEEVQEILGAINNGGTWTTCPGCVAGPLQPKPPPGEICSGPQPPPQCAAEWKGAQTTIQRWYLDPLVDDSGVDRTLRTVFTHDHFGPSTHQQAGLYAGLVVEPIGSTWTSNDGAVPFGTHTSGSLTDGGPTSWEARIITSNAKDSYREFLLEFQDLQLAYQKLTAYPNNKPSSDIKTGFIDAANAINAPQKPTGGLAGPAYPSLITTGIPQIPAGTESVNYLNDPLAFRLGQFDLFRRQKFSDLSYAYDNSIQDTVNGPFGPGESADPWTPLMRAYQSDNVQVRVLVGAHVFSHQFNFEGPTWFSEPSWKNSGYRSAQAMGLSEHFEFLFKVPSSSAPSTGRKCPDGKSNVNCADYLYSPSMDESGLANGLWGFFRSYDPNAQPNDPILKTIAPLPNNPIAPGTNVTYATCPANASKRSFNITAVTAQKALASQNPFPENIVFNSRAPFGGNLGNTLTNGLGIMYVRTEDLNAQGQLKTGVPVEPLILRANAGDCIEVNLTNGITTGDNNNPGLDSKVFQATFNMAPPTSGSPYPTRVSRYVGLHPQLLSYDALTGSGMNVGWNSQGQTDQVIPFNGTTKYQWYAGKIDRAANGTLTYAPVEFGSLNLFPSDPLFQQINGLFGSMIIEPQGSKWQCGEPGSLGACDFPAATPPTTRAAATVTAADGSKFREFALMISDNLIISPNPSGAANSSAVNYRTEPWKFRYPPANTTLDFSCMLSNQLDGAQVPPPTAIGNPQTPIFSAAIGDRVRFRMTHPFGTGTSQVFTVHGHVWQRNPYMKDSTVIGNNNLSQWLGSRDNHGSTDHFDLTIDKAGGEGKKGGDYLYSVFLPNQAKLGAWGIFRVGPSNPQGPFNAACAPVPAPAGYVAPAVKDDGASRFTRQPINTGSKP